MAMPAPIPEPPPCPGENACDALDTDGEPPVEGPKPLHTSPTALRVDGDAALAPDFFGATELANTGCPPRLVTPAVAP